MHGNASDEFRILNAMLMYYLHINPDELTDDEWAARVNELEWIRKEEAKAGR